MQMLTTLIFYGLPWIKCPDCKQDVDSEFNFCPHCGRKLKEKEKDE